MNKNNSGWSETPPEDITTVKSLKFDFGSIELNVNEEIVLEWPMRAPAGSPVNEPTWNSFGYGATYPDENGPEPFLPSEPIKVGYFIQPDPSSTVNLGDYVWEDMNKNGIQDADEPGINGVLVDKELVSAGLLQVDISGLSSGIYYVQLTNTGDIVKFIKQ